MADWLAGAGWPKEFINSDNRPDSWQRAKMFKVTGGRLNPIMFAAFWTCEPELGSAPTEDDALSFLGWALGIAQERGGNERGGWF
jgi:hypothetical protein